MTTPPLTRSQLEEAIMHVCAPVNPAKFRAWLRSLSNAMLIKEYLCVMRCELKEAA